MFIFQPWFLKCFITLTKLSMLKSLWTIGWAKEGFSRSTAISDRELNLPSIEIVLCMEISLRRSMTCTEFKLQRETLQRWLRSIKQQQQVGSKEFMGNSIWNLIWIKFWNRLKTIEALRMNGQEVCLSLIAFRESKWKNQSMS